MMGRRRRFSIDTMPHQMELAMEPGDYAESRGAYEKLGWFLMAPNGAVGYVRPPVFTIQEHEDGAITVGPASILFAASGDKPAWHGYLHNGEWTE